MFLGSKNTAQFFKVVIMLEIMKFYVGNFWVWLGLTVAGFVILSVVSETIIQLIKSITTIIRGYPNNCKCK